MRYVRIRLLKVTVSRSALILEIRAHSCVCNLKTSFMVNVSYNLSADAEGHFLLHCQRGTIIFKICTHQCAFFYIRAIIFTLGKQVILCLQGGKSEFFSAGNFLVRSKYYIYTIDMHETPFIFVIHVNKEGFISDICTVHVAIILKFRMQYTSLCRQLVSALNRE
jgi:hypothetical protein